MRWLIIQSDGEHKGQDGWTPNYYLRECYAIQYALQQNSQEATIWGLRHDNFNDRPDFESYDIIFCLENYETAWLPNFEHIRKPLKMQWIIDLHCQKWQNHDVISKHMDYILHSTKSLLNEYAKLYNRSKHLYFPNGIDSRFFYNRNSPKDIDLCFVGSKNPSRKELIERLEREHQLVYRFATGTDMIDLISRTKVHFNKNISCDINYRTFETIGLGSCLLTNYDENLLELGFVDKVNCLLYNSYEDCVEKIRYGLTDENYVKISRNAQELIPTNTYMHRVSQLLQQLKG